jgi:hypothetical protein
MQVDGKGGCTADIVPLCGAVKQKMEIQSIKETENGVRLQLPDMQF